jgi:hypothetical protein
LFNPVQILLKTAVKLEKGGDKTENRILVLTPYRLFLLTAKVPTKIDHHIHYLDIQAVESRKANQLILRISENKAYSFRPATDDSANSSEAVDQIIVTLATAIRSIFPGVLLDHVIPKVSERSFVCFLLRWPTYARCRYVRAPYCFQCFGSVITVSHKDPDLRIRGTFKTLGELDHLCKSMNLQKFIGHVG